MSDEELTVRIKDRYDHDDGGVTVIYEVVNADGEVVETFTGRAGAALRHRGDDALLEAGRRLRDPRMNNKV